VPLCCPYTACFVRILCTDIGGWEKGEALFSLANQYASRMIEIQYDSGCPPNRCVSNEAITIPTNITP
jgi:hypothetical protein